MGAGSVTAQQASHVVGIGIQPIVALAVESDGTPMAPGDVRTDRFALTTNLDESRLVARLDGDLPPGVRLFVAVETDLASGSGEHSVSGGREVILAGKMARGVRRGQVLRLRVEGATSESIARSLSLGLVDPGSGKASWQTVPVPIATR